MTTREQLHQIIDQLPEAEVPEVLELLRGRQAGGGAALEFWNPPSLEEIIARHGVKPITNLQDLAGDFWPEDEGPDDFINAVREWRREGHTEPLS